MASNEDGKLKLNPNALCLLGSFTSVHTWLCHETYRQKCADHRGFFCPVWHQNRLMDSAFTHQLLSQSQSLMHLLPCWLSFSLAVGTAWTCNLVGESQLYSSLACILKPKQLFSTYMHLVCKTKWGKTSIPCRYNLQCWVSYISCSNCDWLTWYMTLNTFAFCRQWSWVLDL